MPSIEKHYPVDPLNLLLYHYSLSRFSLYVLIETSLR
jgi:hypothetical protein